jgi:trimethylamine--corrinoid protein Co-methyltransferase
MAKKIIEMATAIAGGRDKLRERPIVSFTNCSVTPLMLPRDCCGIIMECARAGMVTQVLTQARRDRGRT